MRSCWCCHNGNLASGVFGDQRAGIGSTVARAINRSHDINIGHIPRPSRSYCIMMADLFDDVAGIEQVSRLVKGKINKAEVEISHCNR
jgi:hypothetical protein